MEISAILLAAGNSSRLGRAKQLLQFKGKSLIRRILAHVIDAGIPDPIIVLGARFQEINLHILKHYPLLRIIENTSWQQGMASSLQKGLSLVPSSSDAVLICLSDQPLIPASHYAQMIQSFKQNNKMVVSAYKEGIGVPAVIPLKYLEELNALSGEKGAKYVLRKYKDQAIHLPCPEAAYDIDTEEDYRRMVEMN